MSFAPAPMAIEYLGGLELAVDRVQQRGVAVRGPGQAGCHVLNRRGNGEVPIDGRLAHRRGKGDVRVGIGSGLAVARRTGYHDGWMSHAEAPGGRSTHCRLAVRGTHLPVNHGGIGAGRIKRVSRSEDQRVAVPGGGAWNRGSGTQGEHAGRAVIHGLIKGDANRARWVGEVSAGGWIFGDDPWSYGTKGPGEAVAQRLPPRVLCAAAEEYRVVAGRDQAVIRVKQPGRGPQPAAVTGGRW